RREIDGHGATEAGERLDRGDVQEVRADERTPGGVLDSARLGARHSKGADRGVDGASAYDCLRGMGAQYEGHGARPRGVLRCEKAGGFREIQGEAEGSDCDHAGAPAAFATEAG